VTTLDAASNEMAELQHLTQALRHAVIKIKPGQVIRLE
jgi:hypothetical protein